MGTLDYLNNLKTIIVLIVAMYHVVMTKDTSFSWYWRTLLIQQSYLMQVCFFISGYLLSISFERKGPQKFIIDKCKRLGLPILLFYPLFYFHPLDFGIMHLWYIEHLLFFCLAYVVFRMYCSPIIKISNQRFHITILFVFVFIISVFCWIIRHYYYIGVWIHINKLISIEPAHTVQYIAMVVLGMLFYKYDWLKTISDKATLVIEGLGLLFFVGYIAIPLSTSSLWFCAWESFFVIFFSIGLILFFKDYCDFSNKILVWLSYQSYGVYLFHLPVILFLDHVIQPFNLNPYIHVIIITILLLPLTYAIVSLLRKSSIVRNVLG